jgi:hypothetical protein
LPGGLEVEPTSPSADAQYLAQGLQQLIQLNSIIASQLDTLIRLEVGQATKNEVKKRIVENDRKARVEQAAAEEAKSGAN